MDRPMWQYHFTDWRGAVEFLNSLEWNLSWQESEQKWWLLGGDQLLFIADTEAELKAFVCGMALSVAALPERILDQIKAMVADL